MESEVILTDTMPMSEDLPTSEAAAPASPEISSADAAPAAVKRMKRGVPEGLWIRCDGCKATVYKKEVEKQLYVCPECQHHFYVPGHKRIEQLLDADSFEEWFTGLRSVDPLGFVDRKPYSERLKDEQQRTGLREACLAGRGYLRGRPLVFALTDSAFIMGRLSSVARSIERVSISPTTEPMLPMMKAESVRAKTSGRPRR